MTGHEEGARVLREAGGQQGFVEFQQVRMGRDVSDEPYCRGLQSFVMAVAPEHHKRIRGTFQRHFTPKRVEGMRVAMTKAARGLVGAIEPRGHADLVEDFALPLPLKSISALLDISEEDQAVILQHITHFKRAVQFLPMDEEALANANATISGLERCFAELIERRRAALGNDPLSMLIQEADAGTLTEAELVANAWGLFAGGYDTTGGAIANGMIELFDHPDQLQALRDDPTLIPRAANELVRYAGPVQAQHRIFPHPVEVGGHTIPPDAPIVTYLIAANRNPRYIDHADALDITCEPLRSHLAFGDGKRKAPVGISR